MSESRKISISTKSSNTRLNSDGKSSGFRRLPLGGKRGRDIWGQRKGHSVRRQRWERTGRGAYHNRRGRASRKVGVFQKKRYQQKSWQGWAARRQATDDSAIDAAKHRGDGSAREEVIRVFRKGDDRRQASGAPQVLAKLPRGKGGSNIIGPKSGLPKEKTSLLAFLLGGVKGIDDGG